MTQTAEFTEIAWTAVHFIGAWVVASLYLIVARRHDAVVHEQDPLTPKAPRLRVAKRQMRERGAWCAFHAIAAVVGVFRMANTLWLEGVIGWSFIIASVLVVVVALRSLYEETRSR